MSPPTPARTDTSSTGRTAVSQLSSKVQIERDRHGVTVEGFRTLGIVSTFIAGVESQCLSLVSAVPDHPKLSEATSALLLIGISLSVLGAALSLLSARWFDLLRGHELTMLDHRWDCAQKYMQSTPKEEKPDPRSEDIEAQDSKEGDAQATAYTSIPDEIKTYIREKFDEKRKWKNHWRDCLVARAIGMAVPIVFCGFFTFVVGMILYTWMAHSLITAIVNTIVTTLGAFLLVCMHLEFDVLVTLQLLSFKRMTLPI